MAGGPRLDNAAWSWQPISQLEFHDPSSLLWLGLVHGDPQAAGQLEVGLEAGRGQFNMQSHLPIRKQRDRIRHAAAHQTTAFTF
jgi:hypothetical protein